MKNRTIFTRDNLEVLRGIEPQSVDLIYLDPPFNSNRFYSAPIGSKAAGSHFKDTWNLDDVDISWWRLIKKEHPSLHTLLEAIKKTAGSNIMSYSIYMAIRLLQMHRILKPTGSLWLHCDPTMSHYLKIILDAIFGAKNYKNEISWKREASGQKGSQHKPKKLSPNRDIILFYCRDYKKTKINSISIPLSEEEVKKKFPKQDKRGRYNTSTPVFSAPSMGDRPNLCYTWNGITNPHPSGWRLSKQRLEEEYQKGNIEIINPAGGGAPPDHPEIIL